MCRQYIDKTTKDIIFALGKGKCVYCKTAVMRGGNMTVDHFVPVYMGGCSHEHNLVLSCETCNEDKANFDPVTYLIKKGLMKDPMFNRPLDAMNTCLLMDKQMKKFEKPKYKKRYYSKQDFAKDAWTK